MAAVSTISTMKVERPRARSSAAPTRENSRSTTPMCAGCAGTKEPICAMIAISAFWRRKVDLPAMLGPVISQMRPAVRICRRRQVAIIGDEGRAVARQRLFDHRMAAALDDEGEAVIDMRAGIVALGGERGKRAGDVERGQRLGALLDAPRSRAITLADEPLEDLQLQPERAVGGAGDLGFQLAQFGGGEAHLAGQGLAVDEGRVERRRHQFVAVLGGDLDEIAEHVVVADL